VVLPGPVAVDLTRPADSLLPGATLISTSSVKFLRHRSLEASLEGAEPIHLSFKRAWGTCISGNAIKSPAGLTCGPFRSVGPGGLSDEHESPREDRRRASGGGAR
jgi:hypothetical protein